MQVGSEHRRILSHSQSNHSKHQSIERQYNTHNAPSQIKQESQRIQPQNNKPRHRAHENPDKSHEHIQNPKSARESRISGGRRVPAHEIGAFDVVVRVVVLVAAFFVRDAADVDGEVDADAQDDGAANELEVGMLEERRRPGLETSGESYLQDSCDEESDFGFLHGDDVQSSRSVGKFIFSALFFFLPHSEDAKEGTRRQEITEKLNHKRKMGRWYLYTGPRSQPSSHTPVCPQAAAQQTKTVRALSRNQRLQSSETGP